ncbi:hypothetical protein SDC9_56127 [bioreactor metagenome]|uniref:Uncharacterized protein n=1 Tax=bioreactor metagenome TaxID=1076179 RepID=A0A644X6L9_9ZZZZ
MKSALLSCSPKITFKDDNIGTFFSVCACSTAFFSFTKKKSRMTASNTSSDEMGNARISFVGPRPGKLMGISIKRAKPTVPTMVAMPPMVLMTPFASLRRSPGIISGMRATTGPLTACLNRLSTKTRTMSSQRLKRAEMGIRPKATAVTGRQMTMNGILRPILVWVLSLIALNTGMRNMANILSKVMMEPIKAFDSTNRARKIGT